MADTLLALAQADGTLEIETPDHEHSPGYWPADTLVVIQISNGVETCGYGVTREDWTRIRAAIDARLSRG